MVKKYIIGNGSIISTEAVVKDIEPMASCAPYFNICGNQMSLELMSDDIVYGLGETLRGANKRGWKYVSWCSDDPNHEENKNSLYGAHNFILIDGVKKLGFFFDTPSEITFDIGYTDPDKLIISMESLNLDLYIIDGEDSPSVVKEFRGLIGRSYIAPLWSFGYQQSRWSYPTAKDVMEVVDEYKKSKIPLECVYLDIDYMERYKDFTLDATKFPNFKEFVNNLKDDHIHLIPIIDAGVKVEDGYDCYMEGVKNGYFCTDKDGKPFDSAVWPGLVHYPDVLNPAARRWFGNKYKVLIDCGIDGFWNDMNEPSIFYTPDRLTECIDFIASKQGKLDLNLDEYFSLTDKLRELPNSKVDYGRMYHNASGKLINHELVHNLYGYNMTRAAGEAFNELREERTLLFSRASYVGMHRYGGIWTGDNKSWWSHIELIMHQLPNLNMVGFLYSGADLGGFSCDTTEDLLMRFIELGMFTPLMRNHACIGTRRQELYQFKHTDDFRNLINLRYALIPYLYSEYVKACLNDEMLFKPLAFKYSEDKMARSIEDQLLVGESIMIAPIYKQNAIGRYVYLPEPMKMVKFRSNNDYDTMDLEKGHHFINVNLNEVLVFILPNKLLPLAKPSMRVEDMDMYDLTYIKNGNDATYDYYMDDGVSKEPNGSIRTLK